jgi:S-formylglutathione hydrolase FrmB
VRRVLLQAVVLLALAPASTAASELESFELPSRLVDTSSPGGELPDGRTVPKVNVLLPDGYDPRSKRGYPVLWLLHGAFEGADRWIGNVAELAEGMPAILVMPDGGRFGMYADWWNDGVRGDPAWARYHLKLLRRAIERRYPVRTGRRWHAIAGISMGGQGTLRYAAMLPGYFGSAVGFSSAFPDMQSDVAYFGLEILPVDAGPDGVYGTIFGPATRPTPRATARRPWRRTTAIPASI